MYNSFAFTRNVIVLTTFNIAYNIKKKRAIEDYIMKIVSININRAKIANIVLNSLCFNAIKIQISNLTSNILNSNK